MAHTKYRILLYSLRLLVLGKRGFFWFFSKIWLILKQFQRIFRNTISFRIYKYGFKLQKKIGAEDLPIISRLWDIFGRRGVLQFFLLIIGLAVLYPHSSLYSFDNTKIPGRNTTLFRLVGPGVQDFTLEEIAMNTAPVYSDQENLSWRGGAVVVQPGSMTGSTSLPISDISGIMAGGGSLIKPNILPGATLPQQSGGSTGRSEIIYHEVQTGESIGQIASMYDLNLLTVLWANNLTERSYIRPGDKLVILPVNGLVHTVKKGDNLGKIAKLYTANQGEIVSFNKLKEDGADIVVGENLIIPNGVKVAVAVAKPAVTSNPTRQYYGLDSVAAPPAGSVVGGYLWPAGVRRITQYFGWRHTGLDIAGPIGTAIYATKAGTVTRSQCGYNGGYGCYIIIDHGGGVTSLYGHNSRLYVVVGDVVEQGQNIALMGSTGRSTGPHLHFEVRIGGVRKNPLSYIK